VRPWLPLLLVAALWPTRVGAHECWIYDDSPGTTRLRPGGDEDSAPTNTLLWLLLEGSGSMSDADFAGAASALTLESDEGDPVELEVEGTISSPVLEVMALRPVEELRPTTGYRAEWSWFGEWGAELVLHEVTFMTGAGPDDEAPETPEEQSRYLESDETAFHWYCGGWDFYDVARFGVDPADDWTMLDGGRPTGDEWSDSPWLRVEDLAEGSRVEMTGTFQPGGRLDYRFSALDLAGNFSGWSEPHRVTMPLAGCSATHESWLPLLLPLPLLRLVRRRRSSGPLWE